MSRLAKTFDRRVPRWVRASDACSHTADVQDVTPAADGCEECLALGDDWVHLRLCLTCGHVGCCDSSKNKHAAKHYHQSGHAIVMSLEPGEDWAWCYADEFVMVPPRQ